MVIFSLRLKAWREQRKISKAEAARLFGFSAQRYQRYEDGRIPEASVLADIAAATGLSTDWLLGCDNPGLALHASAYLPATKPGSSDMMLRDAPATPPQPLCRYPADCDLVQELSAQRHAQADVQAQLATLSTQVETLTRLLGATLAASTQNVAHDKQKAG